MQPASAPTRAKPSRVTEPEMVAIPAGEFQMGCVNGKECENDMKPVHTVKIPHGFRLGMHEVTFAEWDACVDAGGCAYKLSDQGWGRGKRPVINVSYNDMQTYIKWLNRETGKHYRLPTEAEWEYAARGGDRTTDYWWGDQIGRNKANCSGDLCGDNFPQTAPVGSFPATAWGLRDMHGNVWELTCSEYLPYQSGGEGPDQRCSDNTAEDVRRVTRGGSWKYIPRLLRAPYRDFWSADDRDNDVGFRLAED